MVKKSTSTPQPKCKVGCQTKTPIPKIDVYETHTSKFVIFSIKGCDYCVKAKKLLAEMKLTHHVIDVPDEKKDFYKEAHSMQTFPQIFYHTRDNTIIKIGGCDELEKLLKVVQDMLLDVK